MADGLIGRALGRLEEATGWTVTPSDRLSYLEEAASDARILDRELRDLAYTALDYIGGKPQDLKATERRKIAQKSRVVWMKDPQAGAAVDLMNDFVFGRGVTKPRAKDPKVQERIDASWDHPANQRIATSHPAQLALGVDMSLQSNLFVLEFTEGDDGEPSQDGLVILSLLDHDSVENVVEHPEDRFSVLWYLARSRTQKWDFDKDAPDTSQAGKQAAGVGADGKPQVKYYAHWRNLQEAQDSGSLDAGYKPADEKLGDGKVFHLAENRTTEMHFGHPRFDRLLRWFNAYNRFMEARVDLMAASAAVVMKRKVKGTPGQVQRMATQALSRRGDLGASYQPGMYGLHGENPAMYGGEASELGHKQPRAGVLTENDSVTHEQFALNTNASNAAEDARMLGAQVSAATRWPRIYYGDAGAGGSLATSTALELPILKAVEARQELFEYLFRWFTDRIIERSVDLGLLDKALSDEELTEAREQELLRRILRAGAGVRHDSERPEDYVERVLQLVEAHEDKVADEVSTERDLSYEFSMPNPLKRAMTDLVTSIQLIAQTFDPNNTNTELSRILLTVALSDALELQDVGDLVEKIFPPGYVDPAVAAMQAQQAPGAAPGQDFGPFGPDQPAGPPGGGPPRAPAGPTGAVGADGQRHPASNPYGGPQRAQPPEQAMQQALVVRGRDGEPVPAAVLEAAFGDLAASRRAPAEGRIGDFNEAVDTGLQDLVDEALRTVEGNGNGNGAGRH